VPAEERVAIIDAALSGAGWPDRDLRVPVVDADTGEFVVLDRHGDVDLVTAVAASCAVPLVWPPVCADGRRFVDGGVRSTANADVATGADSVVVLAPLPRSASRRHSVPAQLARTGARATAAVCPDREAYAAMGKDFLDPAQRAASAQAGRRQAPSVAERFHAVWERGR
jgi:NTE family protein